MSTRCLTSHFHGIESHIARNCEANRLSTFQDWQPYYHASAVRLASAGFHFTKNDDEVECSWCGIKRKGWKHGEIPVEVHEQLRPDCPFLRRVGALGCARGAANAPSNVPIPAAKNLGSILRHELKVYLREVNGGAEGGIQDTRNADNNDNDVNAVLFPGVNMRTQRRRRSNSLSLTGVATAADGRTVAYTAQCPMEDMEDKGPLYPDFDMQSKRHHSFWCFPTEKEVLVDPLCKSGFFYTGYHDTVVCYQCGLSLQDWRVKGPTQDYPDLTHARWMPTCLQVRKQSNLALYTQRELQVMGQ